jgi:hypothetical protein
MVHRMMLPTRKSYGASVTTARTAIEIFVGLPGLNSNFTVLRVSPCKLVEWPSANPSRTALGTASFSVHPICRIPVRRINNDIVPVSRMATPFKGLPLTHISRALVLKMGARTRSFSRVPMWAGSWLSLLASIALAAGFARDSNGVGSAPPTAYSPGAPTYNAGGKFSSPGEPGGVHGMGLVVIPGRCASARVRTSCSSA